MRVTVEVGDLSPVEGENTHIRTMADPERPESRLTLALFGAVQKIHETVEGAMKKYLKKYDHKKSRNDKI